MARIPLSFAADSPLLAPLFDGTVQIEDVDLTIHKVEPQERHARMAHDLEFDVCEYSSINYMSGFHGGLAFTAIPVFPWRIFRHRDIWVSVESDIQEPGDLNHKRIGLQSWANSAALWQRGALSQDFGFEPESVDWVANIPEEQAYTPPDWLRLRQKPKGTTLEGLLLAGEIDAMMVPWPSRWRPEDMEHVRRLFPDYVAAEQAYYGQHSTFPIMHIVVIQNRVLDAHPGIAQRVYDGLARAMDQWVQQHRDANTESPVWPGLSWYEQEDRLGLNPWPSGLFWNQPTLQTAMGYALNQGILAQPLGVEEIFSRDGKPLVAPS